MAFRLTRRGALTGDTHRLADEELTAAIDRLGDLGQPADLRVHGARKSIKRVRALLRLVRAAMPASRFREHNAALRDAARGLSAARDAAVALATFDALIPEPDVLLGAVRADLLARRDDPGAHNPLAQGGPDPALLQTAAQALSVARPALLADLGPLDWDVLAAGLRDSYGGGRAAMQAALAGHDGELGDLGQLGHDDEAFHDWRKRAKDLWYQCQLLRDACPELLGALEGMLADLGELLGEDHDLAVLQASASASPALHARIAAQHGKLRAAAWRLGQRVHAERPRAFLRRMRVYWRTWRADEPL